MRSRLDLALYPLWLSAFIPFIRMKAPSGAWEPVVVFSLIALVTLLFSLRRRGGESSSAPSLRSRLFTLGVAFVGLFSHPAVAPGFWPVVVVLSAGTLAALVRLDFLERRIRSLEPLAWATVLVGILSAAWWEIEPLIQSLGVRSPLAVALARALGYEAWNDGRVFGLARGVDSWTLGTSARYSELFPALLAAALGVFALLRRGLSTRSFLLRAAAVLLLCATWRELVVLGRGLLLSDGSPVAQRQRFALIAYAIAWMPLLLALGAIVRRREARSEPRERSAPAPAWARGLALAGILTMVFGLSFRPAGIAKQGRIAVDGIHSNWEWTDVPLNRELWGTKTTYSYWSLMVWLRQHFPKVDNVAEGVLDDATLAQYDVWILKTPTKAWSEDERAALERYVANGGGLWLIGDHTNIFGMNHFLNGVADRFGIHYNPDAAFDMPNKRDRQLWRAPARNSGATQLLDEFLFATSDTLSVDPWRVDPIMVGDQLYADDADYSSVTFFGNSNLDSHEAFGRFVQCAATRHGKGRVVAFADSTCFSSFFMHLPGKPELALGTINWLNHRERIPAWRELGLGLGAAMLLGAAGSSLLRNRGRDLASLARPALAGAVLGYGLAGLCLPLGNETVPEPKFSLPRVGVMRGSPLALQERKIPGHPEADPHGFLTYYIGFQRSGAIPVVEHDPVRVFDHDMAVMIEPARWQLAALDETLPRYLKDGGNAWLISENPHLINRLLASCGVAESGESGPASWVRTPWDAKLAARKKASCGEEGKAGHDCASHGGAAHGGAGHDCSGCSSDQDPKLLDEGIGGCVHNANATFKGRDIVHERTINLPPHLATVRGLDTVLQAPEGFEGAVHGSIRIGKGVLYITSAPTLLANQTFGDSTEVPTKERHEVWEIVWETIDRCLGRREG